MAAIGRFAIFVVFLVVLFMPQTQNTRRDSMLEGVPSGKTRVLDLSYADNDKLVPWPGDAKFFEAKVKATVGKEGYFTPTFCSLTHDHTHRIGPTRLAQ